MEPLFFPTPDDFRAWLEAHHEQTRDLWVGFYKQGSGRPSITWPEAVDEALCFGWIDGLRKGIDEVSYAIRFTPRQARSVWSAVNIERVRVLTEQGRLRPAGLRAFASRVEARSGIYAYEQAEAPSLAAEEEAAFRANAAAWAFFSMQAPSYQRTALWWVISAKKPATRRARLARLIDDSAQGRTIPPLTRRPRSG